MKLSRRKDPTSNTLDLDETDAYDLHERDQNQSIINLHEETRKGESQDREQSKTIQTDLMKQRKRRRERIISASKEKKRQTSEYESLHTDEYSEYNLHFSSGASPQHNIASVVVCTTPQSLDLSQSTPTASLRNDQDQKQNLKKSCSFDSLQYETERCSDMQHDSTPESPKTSNQTNTVESAKNKNHHPTVEPDNFDITMYTDQNIELEEQSRQREKEQFMYQFEGAMSVIAETEEPDDDLTRRNSSLSTSMRVLRIDSLIASSKDEESTPRVHGDFQARQSPRFSLLKQQQQQKSSNQKKNRSVIKQQQSQHFQSPKRQEISLMQPTILEASASYLDEDSDHMQSFDDNSSIPVICINDALMPKSMAGVDQTNDNFIQLADRNYHSVSPKKLASSSQQNFYQASPINQVATQEANRSALSKANEKCQRTLQRHSYDAGCINSKRQQPLYQGILEKISIMHLTKSLSPDRRLTTTDQRHNLNDSSQSISKSDYFSGQEPQIKLESSILPNLQYFYNSQNQLQSQQQSIDESISLFRVKDFPMTPPSFDNKSLVFPQRQIKQSQSEKKLQNNDNDEKFFQNLQNINEKFVKLKEDVKERSIVIVKEVKAYNLKFDHAIESGENCDVLTNNLAFLTKIMQVYTFFTSCLTLLLQNDQDTNKIIILQPIIEKQISDLKLDQEDVQKSLANKPNIKNTKFFPIDFSTYNSSWFSSKVKNFLNGESKEQQQPQRSLSPSCQNESDQTRPISTQEKISHQQTLLQIAQQVIQLSQLKHQLIQLNKSNNDDVQNTKNSNISFLKYNSIDSPSDKSNRLAPIEQKTPNFRKLQNSNKKASDVKNTISSGQETFGKHKAVQNKMFSKKYAWDSASRKRVKATQEVTIPKKIAKKSNSQKLLHVVPAGSLPPVGMAEAAISTKESSKNCGDSTIDLFQKRTENKLQNFYASARTTADDIVQIEVSDVTTGSSQQSDQYMNETKQPLQSAKISISEEYKDMSNYQSNREKETKSLSNSWSLFQKQDTITVWSSICEDPQKDQPNTTRNKQTSQAFQAIKTKPQQASVASQNLTSARESSHQSSTATIKKRTKSNKKFLQPIKNNNTGVNQVLHSDYLTSQNGQQLNGAEFLFDINNYIPSPVGSNQAQQEQKRTQLTKIGTKQTAVTKVKKKKVKKKSMFDQQNQIINENYGFDDKATNEKSEEQQNHFHVALKNQKGAQDTLEEPKYHFFNMLECEKPPGSINSNKDSILVSRKISTKSSNSSYSAIVSAMQPASPSSTSNPAFMEKTKMASQRREQTILKKNQSQKALLQSVQQNSLRSLTSDQITLQQNNKQLKASSSQRTLAVDSPTVEQKQTKSRVNRSMFRNVGNQAAAIPNDDSKTQLLFVSQSPDKTKSSSSQPSQTMFSASTKTIPQQQQLLLRQTGVIAASNISMKRMRSPNGKSLSQAFIAISKTISKQQTQKGVASIANSQKKKSPKSNRTYES